jgi:hypothetical protein
MCQLLTSLRVFVNLKMLLKVYTGAYVDEQVATPFIT